MSARPGEVLEVSLGPADAQTVTVDCGAYGKIHFDVPIGGKFRLRLGTEAPIVYFDDVETPIFESGNVVRLKDSD